MAKLGLVSVCALASVLGAAGTEKATVKSDSEPVYSQPSSSSGFVNYLKKGDAVAIDFVVSGDAGKWCGVATTIQPVTAGYVPCSHLDWKGNPKVDVKVATPAPAPSDEARPLVERGLTEARNGHAVSAVQECTAATRLNPGDAAGYRCLGWAYSNLGHWEQALQEYTEAIRRNPRDGAVYLERGFVYGQIGKRDLEIQDYTLAISLNPRDSAAYARRGTVRHMKSDFEGAVADFSLAIQFDPNGAAVYGNRAVSLALLGRESDAQRDYNRCLALDRSLAKIYEPLFLQAKTASRKSPR